MVAVAQVCISPYRLHQGRRSRQKTVASAEQLWTSGRDIAVKGNFLPTARGWVSLYRNMPASKWRGFGNEKTALCRPLLESWVKATDITELGRNLAKKRKKNGMWIWSNLVLQLLIYRNTRNRGIISENLTMRSTGRQITRFSPQKGMGGGDNWRTLIWKCPSLGPDADELLQNDSKMMGHVDTAWMWEQVWWWNHLHVCAKMFMDKKNF